MTLWLRSTLVAFACLVAASASGDAKEPEFSSAEIRADLDELIDHIEGTHPDLGYVADKAELARMVATVREEIDRSMNVREAWMTLARLNPYFADAHTGLRHPAAEFEAYRDAGGATFPIPVLIDRQGVLRVAAGVPVSTGPRPFERIIAINGKRSEAIIAALMPRMRGETESLRRLVLSFNFAALLWTLDGPADAYHIEVIDTDGKRREVSLSNTPQGSVVLPPSLSFPRPGVALLRVPSFDPSLRERFDDFMETSIKEIETRGAQVLLIDIRDNPGGAHDVSDQLVAWLTNKAVSPNSALTARITEENRDISPVTAIGSVVTVPFEEPIEPRADRKRFRGKVYVLVSENTYSQAIVFAATMQDHGLGIVVGERTGGAANQTGQITLHPLAHSGMQALAPLYIIYRPSGDRARIGLAPNIVLAHDSTASTIMIEQLLAMLPAATQN